MFPTAFVVLLGFAIICRLNAKKVGGGGGRGGGSGGGGGRDKFSPVLLWSAVALFAAAGTMAPRTFVGDIVGAICGIHPAIAWLAGAGMIVAIIRDLWHDREPDKAAPFALFLLPSISTHLGGWIGTSLARFWDMYGDMIQTWLHSATGL